MDGFKEQFGRGDAETETTNILEKMDPEVRKNYEKNGGKEALGRENFEIEKRLKYGASLSQLQNISKNLINIRGELAAKKNTWDFFTPIFNCGKFRENVNKIAEQEKAFIKYEKMAIECVRLIDRSFVEQTTVEIAHFLSSVDAQTARALEQEINNARWLLQTSESILSELRSNAYAKSGFILGTLGTIFSLFSFFNLNYSVIKKFYITQTTDEIHDEFSPHTYQKRAHNEWWYPMTHGQEEFVWRPDSPLFLLKK